MNVLRWIAVLPASFIALFLSSQFVKVLVYITNLMSPEESDPDGLFIQCMIAVINIFAFVGAGSIVAPKKQETVGVILSFIMLALSIGQFYLFYDIIVLGWNDFEWTSFWTSISLILVLRTIISVVISTIGIIGLWPSREEFNEKVNI